MIRQDLTSPSARLRAYRPDISLLLVARDEPQYRHLQVYEHLMRRPGIPFEHAGSLPGELRPHLDALGGSTLTLVERSDSSDATTKLLLAAHDSALIETVVMRYPRRTTVCASTQVGCPVGCAFCATGGLGFQRNLCAAEIVDQVRAARVLLQAEERRVSNVVFMGMGEPMLNVGSVLEALGLLTDPAGLGMASRALAVSTVGIPSGMLRLAREAPQVSLALSLPATHDRLRAELIPPQHRYPLKQVMDAARRHFELTHRKLLIEYVVLGGLNHGTRDARSLARLLHGLPAAVNLLPWNPARGAFRRVSLAELERFRNVLEAAGIEAVIRESRGVSIAAACGQLAARRTGAHISPHPTGTRAAGDRSSPRRRLNGRKTKPTHKV